MPRPPAAALPRHQGREAGGWKGAGRGVDCSRAFCTNGWPAPWPSTLCAMAGQVARHRAAVDAARPMEARHPGIRPTRPPPAAASVVQEPRTFQACPRCHRRCSHRCQRHPTRRKRIPGHVEAFLPHILSTFPSEDCNDNAPEPLLSPVPR
ncbi:hypothetical protein I4F81_000052 [Pyropia yezoensis]|uniref:Uncharacterized protein n=1 Tax=Pyropia yezoensis TaxID=2788 RepID=A0ACC3BHT5_PYRYE|nr:hypothetical protein I4F81_000052 [Neopyropia yezoensis]